MLEDAPNPDNTPDELTADHVRHIAKLARLDPTDAEVEVDRERLAAVLGYMEGLRALELDDVEPLMHVGDEANRLADDTPGESLDPETIRRLAPSSFVDARHDADTGETTEHVYIRVPKVIGPDQHGGGGA